MATRFHVFVTVLLLSVASISSAQDESLIEERQPRLALRTQACPQPPNIIGVFESVDVPQCTQDSSCFVFTGTGVSYSLKFKPGKNITTLMSTAGVVGNAASTSRRYVTGEFRGSETLEIEQTFTLPISGNGVKTYTVEWKVVSGDTSETLVCQRFDFTSIDWEFPNQGNQTGVPCDYPGLACDFAFSVCGADNVCGCDSSAEVSGTRCRRSFGYSCGSTTDCSGDAVACTATMGGNVCRCSANGFELDNRCVVKTGSRVGAACVFPNQPCAFANSLCGANYLCGCDATATPSSAGACKTRPDYPCTNSANCVDNASCMDRPDATAACVCNPGFTLVDGDCVLMNNATMPGEACDEPWFSCRFPNSICREGNGTGTCGCDANFLYQDGQCRLMAKAPCFYGSQQFTQPPCVSGAECQTDPIDKVTKTCVCGPNYMELDGGLCAPKLGEKVGDSCGVTGIPCAFDNSECTSGEDGATCQCHPAATEQYGYCRIRRGYACSTTAECVEFSSCLNGRCACDAEKEEVGDGKCAGCTFTLYAPLLVVMAILSKLIA